jgi:hypothetical protein
MRGRVGVQRRSLIFAVCELTVISDLLYRARKNTSMIMVCVANLVTAENHQISRSKYYYNRLFSQ